MHLLHRALDEDGHLQDAVFSLGARIRDNPLKSGLLLDFNPVWLATYRSVEAGLSESAYEGLWPWGNGTTTNVFGPGPDGDIPDLQRSFGIVEQMINWLFGRQFKGFQPYLLRIVALPSPDGSESWRDQRIALTNAARESPIPTIVETRAPPRLVASPGDRLVSAKGRKGTLGGFLLNQHTGEAYAVTCGHVATTMGHVSDAVGNPIGSCKHAMLPVPLPHGVVCHSACGAVTDLDLSLISPAGTPGRNVASSVAQVISNGHIVEMHGATSGRRRYQIGAAVVEHSIGGSCWSRLHQIYAPTPGGVLPAWVHLATTPPPDQGDSGAWLIRANTEWTGMVVAADALFGYALAATELIAKANSQFGMDLKLL